MRWRTIFGAVLPVLAACTSTSNDGSTSNLPPASDPLANSSTALPFGGDIAACEADTNAMWDRDIPRVGFADDHTVALDAAIVAVMKKHAVPGLALVTTGNATSGITAARGYGFADPARHELMNPDQTFRLGDLGRAALEAAFTALGALPQDVEFALGDLVADLPNVPPTLTFEHLFSGSEGWDDADYDPFAHAKIGDTRDSLLRAALATLPKNPPGKVVKPSHTGALLLAYAMEKKFKLTLPQVVAGGSGVQMSSALYKLAADFGIGHASAQDRTDAEVHYVDDAATPNPAYDHLPIDALGAASIVGSPLGLARSVGSIAGLPRITHIAGSTIFVFSSSNGANGAVAMMNTWKTDAAVEAAIADELSVAVTAGDFSGAVSGPSLDAFTEWTTPNELVLGAGRTDVYPGFFRVEGRYTDKFELRAKPSRTLLESTYGATCPAFRQRHDSMLAAKYVLISYQTFDAPDGHRRYQAVWARPD